MWLSHFSVMQLKGTVRAKDSALNIALLKIREGIVDDEVASLIKSRLRPIQISSIDLKRTVIICFRRKEVDEINEECLNYIDDSAQEYEAIDTDTNSQPLGEADRLKLNRTALRLPNVLVLKEGSYIVLRRNLQMSESGLMVRV